MQLNCYRPIYSHSMLVKLHILFSLAKKSSCQYFVGNTKIEQQFDAKFLGVIISSDLGWSKHI